MAKGSSNPSPSSNGSPHPPPRDAADPPHDRASSPQNPAKPQPKPNPPPLAASPAPEGGPIDLNPPPPPPQSGASGFVGILARRQPGSGDSHVAVEGISGATEAQARRRKYELHMAREVETPAAESPPPPLVAPIPEPRRWSPLILTLAVSLFAIGLWAAGAIFYMQRIAPAEASHYPLIGLTTSEPHAFTHQSVMLAWIFLPCLPLSLVLGAIVLWRKRTRLAR